MAPFMPPAGGRGNRIPGRKKAEPGFERTGGFRRSQEQMKSPIAFPHAGARAMTRYSLLSRLHDWSDQERWKYGFDTCRG